MIAMCKDGSRVGVRAFLAEAKSNQNTEAPSTGSSAHTSSFAVLLGRLIGYALNENALDGGVPQNNCHAVA